jgi:hypothetical protein
MVSTVSSGWLLNFCPQADIDRLGIKINHPELVNGCTSKLNLTINNTLLGV